MISAALTANNILSSERVTHAKLKTHTYTPSWDCLARSNSQRWINYLPRTSNISLIEDRKQRRLELLKPLCSDDVTVEDRTSLNPVVYITMPHTSHSASRLSLISCCFFDAQRLGIIIKASKVKLRIHYNPGPEFQTLASNLLRQPVISFSASLSLVFSSKKGRKQS